jgi:hypothetical protein
MSKWDEFLRNLGLGTVYLVGFVVLCFLSWKFSGWIIKPAKAKVVKRGFDEKV